MAIGLHDHARMSRYSSALKGSSEPVSEFRVEKSRAAVKLTLSNGTSARGCFFVSGSSKSHAGPERVKDVLNGEADFLPFEASGPRGAATVLYNREQIVMVELDDKTEAQKDPGYDVATVRNVTMHLSNGMRLRGAVRVHRPRGR